jgi:hypothetical protein
MNLFVDTSAFIALIDKSDSFHPQAKGSHFRLYSSNFILDEVITYLRMHVSHSTACQFRDEILASPLYHIHHVTSEIEEEAYALFKKHDDKRLSFTDCTSFALMKRLGITSAFTFDDDFEQVGFTKFPA